MNREILFKGKRKNWKELPKEKWWVEGYYFCMVHNDGSHVHHFIIPLGIDLSFGTPIEKIQVEVDPETVCRHICLKDNNVRAYQGDICTLFDIVENVRLTGIIRFGEYEQDGSAGEYPPVPVIGFYIEFIKYDFTEDSYCDKYSEWKQKISFLQAMDKSYYAGFDVIGNIFDNPELLGTGNTSWQQDR